MKNLIVLVSWMALLTGCSLTPPIHSPTGQHLVGYERFALTANDDSRWVDVQAYYPARTATDEPLQATPEALAEVLAQSYSMPSFLMKDERLLPVYLDAPAANGRFAVLIFNHGHASYARQNQDNFVELASHGYVVLTLNHPGFSLLSRNGEQIVYQAPGTGDYDKDQLSALLAQQALDWQQLRDADNLERWRQRMDVAQQNSFADIMPEFDQWIANNQLVLNALPSIAQGSQALAISDAIDINRIGYFGHSFGGAVATYMNLVSEQVRASFNLDGPVFVQSLDHNQPGEHCFAYGNEGHASLPESDFSYINQAVAKQLNGCEMVFLDAGHMNFTDLNQLSILRRFGVLGSVDSEQMRANLQQALQLFFDQHLRSQGEISKLSGTEFIQH